jgi:diacylglycerol kinase family enzyme
VAAVVNESRAALPLAVLPLGNENLFARALGFTADAARLAEVIAGGRTQPVDLGSANGRLFSLMLGAGFDADVVHRFARARSRVVGLGRASRGRYLAAILAALLGHRQAPIVVEAAGRARAGAHALVVNVPAYALGLPILPTARPDDGLLDWILFERPGRRALVRYLAALPGARHLARRDVAHGRAHRLRITSAAPVPVHADGDPLGSTPVDVEVRPGALPVLVT